MSRPLIKVLGLIAAIAVVLIGIFVAATPAHATEDPPQQFTTVAWTIDSPADIWSPAQHFPIRVDGPAVDFAGVQALVSCGRYYQLDGYVAGDVTEALIAGGVLYGPNNPAEVLANGAPGTEATNGTPYMYFQSPDCSETICADTHTQQTTTYNHQFVDGASTRVDVASSLVQLTDGEAVAAGCYVIPPVVGTPVDVQLPTISSAYVEPVLAHTGPETLWLIPLSLAVLAAGVALIATRVRGRRSI